MNFLKDNGMHLGILWLRILMGAGMAYHGYGKVFGGFMDRLIGGVTDMGFPLPVFFAWAAALSEFLGGILVVIGFKTRIASFFIICTMAVAAFVVHAKDPFQVKELALAYLAVSVAIFLVGPGKYSWDGSLGRKKQ